MEIDIDDYLKVLEILLENMGNPLPLTPNDLKEKKRVYSILNKND